MPEFHDQEAWREFAGRPNEKDLEANVLIGEWLDMIEDLASGVNLGVYDLQVVDRLIGNRVMRGWRNLEPWVEARREFKRQPTLYCEFEELAYRLYELDTGERSPDIRDAPELRRSLSGN